jgi:small subunit ribosomal protein S9
MAQENYIGRRKTSTARLYIKNGNGSFSVNSKPIEDYFNTKARLNVAKLPLTVTELDGKYDIKVTVRGGGVTGQAGAVSLALARALDDLNEDVHSKLKDHGLLTRDDRMVERKKYGQPKARKRFQFSKR